MEPFRKKCLLVTRDQAVPLEEDEYFIADLIGLRVITDEDKVLGELTDVLETGANDVYQVTDENGKEILLPAIKDCILSVDLEKGEHESTHTGRTVGFMNYHVLTLFPEMILQGLNTSIIGRAIEKGILSLEAVNIRDYAG